MTPTVPEQRSESRRFVRKYLRNRALMFGSVIILIMALCAVLAPWLAPYDPAEQYTDHALEGPSAQFPLGTDMFGRDQLSRIIYGTRLSFVVSSVSVGIALLLGTLLGLIAATTRGWIDNLIMRVMDVLFAFPFLLLVIAIMAAFGTSLVNAMIAIGIVYTPSFARVTRAASLNVMEQLYIEASHSLGANKARMIFRHVLPNIQGPLIIQTTLSLAFAILAEAALSFLGLGAQPPTPSWGLMLNEGRDFFNMADWLAIFPGIAITLAVLGFNLLGDGLRDLLDPRDQK
ncbi:ABC transporter permease [Deinococcus peraridilitoris]|uniref:ABC-type dipeptide/oligopeptide/nickel transport system, permease component n=1 Tax=Deinococcus peraridilitoris (strain DSM 19664 / LMG 22246 / CIP 109416 / KR-200) TaxID=937777 RepID=L0A6D7_DEIPD|nr:ABC transporter permease [Deinococcus peraridilitoris]AFZ69448.1 ABC-type dipeptide/oligopeptide/nickel transport system, permease component [Deinococcus peraridilitoris DSM 19664]